MRTFAVLVAVLLLSACAGTRSLATSSPSLLQQNQEVDYERVAMVERQARDSGAQLIWLNVPTKEKIADNDL